MIVRLERLVMHRWGMVGKGCVEKEDRRRVEGREGEV